MVKFPFFPRYVACTFEVQNFSWVANFWRFTPKIYKIFSIWWSTLVPILRAGDLAQSLGGGAVYLNIISNRSNEVSRCCVLCFAVFFCATVKPNLWKKIDFLNSIKQTNGMGKRERLIHIHDFKGRIFFLPKKGAISPNCALFSICFRIASSHRIFTLVP